jgi:Tfp pilus assembly protein PilZ
LDKGEMMKLGLENKMTENEINELKDRLYSGFMVMFEEGTKLGKTTNKEYDELDENIKNTIQMKINELVDFFGTDCLWIKEPPKYYNERKKISGFDYSNRFADEVNEDIKNEFEEEIPEWVNKSRPFD